MFLKLLFEENLKSRKMFGGFVPRNLSQFAKDPAWCLAGVALSFYICEFQCLALKMQCQSFVMDPNRYKYVKGH